MQDLSRYQKRDELVISARYVSPLLVGSVLLLGLVFSAGVLVGGRGETVAANCPEPDLLARLNEQSGEPAPPTAVKAELYHTALEAGLQRVPVPASLKQVKPGDESQETVSEEQQLQNVRLQQPRMEETPVPEKVRDSEAGIFTLQVGSFQDQREASLMVQRLKQAGHKSFLVRVNMPDQGGVWYRVRVGPFASKREAWAYKSDFESKERLPAFVVKRRG